MVSSVKTIPTLAFLLVPLLAACGGHEAVLLGPQHAEIPVRDTSPKSAPRPPHETPPLSHASKASPFPKVVRMRLPNGLELLTTEAHTLPIVQIRVLVKAGMGYAANSAGTPGAAEITAQMLKDGGTRTMTSARLLDRVESLGANIDVEVGCDAATFGMAVATEHLGEALAILGELVSAPRFDEGELKKLKARESDEAEDNARANGTWTATRVLFRELFSPTNPYATYALVPSEIAKVTPQAIRDFHRRFYVPKNATIILAGDIDAHAGKLVESAFGAWRGGEPPKIDFPPAIPVKGRRVVVAHRPRSAQSDIFVVNLIPERKTAAWPQIRVANQVLGGGVASRLFNDVREQRALAYSARSQVIELSHGQQPLVAYAGTDTLKTGLAVEGLLENLEKLATGGVTTSEAETARRYISDIFAVRMETVGSIADMIALAESLGLPDGYWDAYRAAVRATTAEQASAMAAKVVTASSVLIVVAGDADLVAAPLSHFADVVIVDPEQEFKTLRTVPMNPRAPLEVDSKPKKK